MTTVLTGSNGARAIVDDDSGSSPAHVVDLNPGKTAAAQGLYSGDMERGYYKPQDDPANYTYDGQGGLQYRDPVRRIETLEAQVKYLLATVAVLGTDALKADAAIAALGDTARIEGGTRFRQNATTAARLVNVENLAANLAMEVSGLRQNVVGLERRCTCHEAEAAEWARVQAQRKEAQK